MTMNDRVRDLRKTHLKLTMEEFGKRLGVGKTAISKVESGENNLSEQLFKSICREFNVRPEWLRDGEGEPFKEVTHKEQIEKFINDILVNEPEGRKVQLISALASLDEAGWDVLYNLALQFLHEEQEERAAGSAAPDTDPDAKKSRPLGTPEGIAEAEAAYEKRFGIVSETEPNVSNTGEGKNA